MPGVTHPRSLPIVVPSWLVHHRMRHFILYIHDIGNSRPGQRYSDTSITLRMPLSSCHSGFRQELPNDLEVAIRFLEIGQVTAFGEGHPAHFRDLGKKRPHTHILRFVVYSVRQKSRAIDSMNLV